ncbi:hypothetical protein [Stutzerimonas degradans]|uniref:hypothetical protein n=1 Tax=Stutzerimonas degradans TaxID=2968968 RepID=UPI0015E0E9C8|nr:hypothetical protein [Stutzerimonas degradans]MCQ4276045.1 hypothetical protein [Stutzerimonas degradans]QPT23641.1 hypothetical protein I6G33_04170 [Stutzerimonas degradans]
MQFDLLDLTATHGEAQVRAGHSLSRHPSTCTKIIYRTNYCTNKNIRIGLLTYRWRVRQRTALRQRRLKEPP